MFNLKVGSIVEFPWVQSLDLCVSGHEHVSVWEEAGVLRIEALTVGIAYLTMGLQDGFELTITIHVI